MDTKELQRSRHKQKQSSAETKKCGDREIHTKRERKGKEEDTQRDREKKRCRYTQREKERRDREIQKETKKKNNTNRIKATIDQSLGDVTL